VEVGIDIEEIERVKNAYKRWKGRFLNRVFSQREVDYCFSKKDPFPSLTGRFCSKEAVIKVCGGRLSFKDIEVVNEAGGKPVVFIKGKRSNIKLSISHSKHYAVAVALKDDGD